jgi:hypothetical protein
MNILVNRSAIALSRAQMNAADKLLAALLPRLGLKPEANSPSPLKRTKSPAHDAFNLFQQVLAVGLGFSTLGGPCDRQLAPKLNSIGSVLGLGIGGLGGGVIVVRIGWRCGR